MTDRLAGRFSRRSILPAAIGVSAVPVLAAPGLAARSLATGAWPVRPAGPLEGASGPLILGPGLHTLHRSLVLNDAVCVLPGARVEIARGASLRLDGPLSAAAAPLFFGAGQVSFGPATAWAYAEWWGARADDPTHDSLEALEQAMAAHGRVQLQVGDYHLSRGWQITRPFSRLWGAGSFNTRLVLHGNTGDVLRLGSDKRPPSVNDFVQGLDVRWLTLTRAQGASADGAGLVGRFLLDAHIEGVRSIEHGTGFLMEGMVHSFMRECVAFRSLNTPVPAPWRGFWAPGLAEIGLAGANASLFIEDCNATIGGRPQIEDPVGLLLEGAFADTFVTRFETAGVATGIRVAGNTPSLGARAQTGHTNLHIVSPILDQCSAVGLEITQTSIHALIDVINPYVALAPQGRAALLLSGMAGACSITGGQLVGRDTAPGEASGLHITDCSGVQIESLKLLDFPRGVILERVRDTRLSGSIGNVSRPASVAILMADSGRIDCAMQITGSTSNIGTGIILGGQIAQVTVNTMLVAPAAIKGEVLHLDLASGGNRIERSATSVHVP